MSKHMSIRACVLGVKKWGSLWDNIYEPKTHILKGYVMFNDFNVKSAAVGAGAGFVTGFLAAETLSAVRGKPLLIGRKADKTEEKVEKK